MAVGLKPRLLLGIIAATLVVGVNDGVAQRKPKSDPAIDSLEHKAKADSNDAVLHHQLAMAYWKVQRYDDSERELREAVTLAPQYAEAYLALSALGPARGEKYWKKVEKDKGRAAVEAAFENTDRYYRKAFLLNPLVDLRIMGKVEERSEIQRGLFIIRIWWLKPFTRSLSSLAYRNYCGEDRAGVRCPLPGRLFARYLQYPFTCL